MPGVWIGESPPPPPQLNMTLMIQYYSRLLYHTRCAVLHTATYLSVVCEKFDVSQNRIQPHMESPTWSREAMHCRIFADPNSQNIHTQTITSCRHIRCVWNHLAYSGLEYFRREWTVCYDRNVPSIDRTCTVFASRQWAVVIRYVSSLYFETNTPSVSQYAFESRVGFWCGLVVYRSSMNYVRRTLIMKLGYLRRQLNRCVVLGGANRSPVCVWSHHTHELIKLVLRCSFGVLWWSNQLT
jgi:hypothetical protein